MRPLALSLFLAFASGFWVGLPRAVADDEVSPETKALLSRLHEDIKSKTPKVRAAAYTAIGELGAKAKGERRRLCEGLLDPNATVQAAAADALKKVDEPLSKVALGLVINQDSKQIEWAATNAKDATPLVPVLLALANTLAPVTTSEKASTERGEARKKFRASVAALVAIDPEDPNVNKSVIAMLSNPVAEFRADAVGYVPSLKHKKLALEGTLTIAVNAKEVSTTREVAVKLIPDLVDENTTPAAVKAVEAIRFDKDTKVRDAVSDTLRKLQK